MSSEPQDTGIWNMSIYMYEGSVYDAYMNHLEDEAGSIYYEGVTNKYKWFTNKEILETALNKHPWVEPILKSVSNKKMVLSHSPDHWRGDKGLFIFDMYKQGHAGPFFDQESLITYLFEQEFNK